MRPSRRVTKCICLLLLLCGGSFLSSAQDAKKPAAKQLTLKPMADMTLNEIGSTGMGLVGAGEYQAAIPFLKEFVRLSRSSSDPSVKAMIETAMFQTGLCYLQTDQFSDCLKTMQQVLAEFPKGAWRRGAYMMMAECYAGEKDWKKAAAMAQDLLANGGLIGKEKLVAHNLIGESYFQMEKWAEALPSLLVVYEEAPEIRQRSAVAAMIATCYVRSEKYKELFEFLPKVYQTPAQYDMKLSLSLIDFADDNFNRKRFDKALLLYRLAYSKAELVAALDRQEEETKSQLENLTKSVENIPVRRALTRALDRMAEQRENINQTEEYREGLMVRTAQTYQELHRYWEALVLFRRVYQEHPQHELAERAMYQAFSTAVLMENVGIAFAEGAAYLEKYPGGQYWDITTLIITQMRMEREEFDIALAVALKAVEVHPKHEMLDHMLYLTGYCYLQVEKFDDALAQFEKVSKEHADSPFVEPAEYAHAMTQLFAMRYTKSREAFTAFVNKYSRGTYYEEALYRLGVAWYGEGNFNEARKALQRFVDSFPKHALKAEALSMWGDIEANESQMGRALDLYRRAKADASNQIQINYATFQTARVYEQLHQFDKIVELFQEYLNDYGEKGNFTEAYYWIGNAQVQGGKRMDALQTFFTAITKYGNNPHYYGIDMIIRDLTEELGQKFEVKARNEFLDRLYPTLESSRKDKTQRTLELRLITLFAGMLQDPKYRQQMVDSLLREDNIEFGSPICLLVMGKQAADSGKKDFARHVYEAFLKKFGTCDLAADAVKAMADIKYAEGKYDEARVLFDDYANRFPMLADAAVVQKQLGDTYRLMKRYDEAIAAYNKLLSVKEWRGSLWPEALYWIGMCEMERDNARPAFAYFQRVYVLYESHAEWVAKAYLKSSECLVKLGQTADAIKTYREMLGKEVLVGRPELETAKQALSQLEGK